MKIADLKQPYRRMAEYLAEKSTNEAFTNKDVLIDAFYWDSTKSTFWIDIYIGEYPPITEEIKKHFPPDFDFSSEDKQYSVYLAYNENDLSNDFKESSKKIHDYIREEFYKAKKRVEEKEYYTQLAKEGKFDQLPDTCEFSKAVKLEVCDGGTKSQIAKVIGKFKGKFVEKENISCVGYTLWNFAQLPTPKIDFSNLIIDDIVEVVTKSSKITGYFKGVNGDNLRFCSAIVPDEIIKIINISKSSIDSIHKLK